MFLRTSRGCRDWTEVHYQGELAGHVKVQAGRGHYRLLLVGHWVACNEHPGSDRSLCQQAALALLGALKAAQ